MSLKIFLSILSIIATLIVSIDIKAQTETTDKSIKTISRSYSRKGLILDSIIYLGQTEAKANPVNLNQWKATTTIYDIKLGYILENNIYYGVEYSIRNDTQISLATSSGSAAGLGLGYFNDNGFNFRGFYRLSEIFENYSNGSGIQADLGYMINLNVNFFIGLAISYRQSTFKTNNTIVAFDTWTRKEIYPFVTVGLIIN